MIEQVKKEYNVCLYGASLDVGNMGCRALAASLVKLVLDNRPDARIFLLYGNRTSETKELKILGRNVKVNIVNYRLSPKARVKEHLFWILLMAFFYRLVPVKSLRNIICRSTPWIKVLAQANFVGDIRGGDSFSDIYGFQRITIGSIPCIIAILMRKKLVLLPQTYGPYKSIVAKILAKYIFRHSERIYARDMNSLELVKNMLGNKRNSKSVNFCPDVAFALDAITPDKLDVQPPIDRNVSVPLIGFNISGLLYNGGYTRNNMFGLKLEYKRFVQALIEQFMEETDAHVLLIPHVFSSGVESDYDACREVLKSVNKKYRDRVHRVMREYNQNEIKGIIGLCDFFIGSRMHSCIAALSQGIPSVGIAYSPKFLGIFESIGLGNNVIDAREWMQDDVLAQCMDRFRKKDIVAKFLIEKIQMTHEQVKSIFKENFSQEKIVNFEDKVII